MFIRPRSAILAPDTTYHVCSRGVRRNAIVLDDLDRRWLVADFARVVTKRRWTCHTFCVMDNHLHLLVKTKEADLPGGMHWLLMRHALRFNMRHGYVGHVFESRYFAEPVHDDDRLIGLARYIDQNPVRAGLCARPEDWKWSGCAATLGMAQPAACHDPSELLMALDPDRGRARVKYALVLSDMRRPRQNRRVPTPGGGTRLV